jgi:hypothetical protein
VTNDQLAAALDRITAMANNHDLVLCSRSPARPADVRWESHELDEVLEVVGRVHPTLLYVHEERISDDDGDTAPRLRRRR